MTGRLTIGVSLKMYFGHEQARRWFDDIADRAGSHPAITAGAVDFFVIPTYLQIPAAIAAFAGTNIRVGAQDVGTADAGAYTGEVSGAELAEVGVALAEVGHAERRRLFGETDGVVAQKVAAALRNNLTPVLCVGETERADGQDSHQAVVRQTEASLRGAPDGPLIVAYEPVWAIGAEQPAPATHIRAAIRALRESLDTRTGRGGTAIIYGGSAGPGLLTELADAVDGLFLGRFAHDAAALVSVLDEAHDIARLRSAS